MSKSPSPAPLHIGWAETDITPLQPALLAGQFSARLSEGIRDPLKATALVLQSGEEFVVFVCCDLVSISDDLRDQVRHQIREFSAEIDPEKIIFNATHTHTAPEIRVPSSTGGHASSGGNGVEFAEALPVEEYVSFASKQLTAAILEAWKKRAPGGVAHGLSYAVLGRNRRWVDRNGVAQMHGLNQESAERFNHIEGYEDHSVNLLATYDEAGNLTGIVFNAPITAQETGGLFEVSADFWHEAREELRQRFGEKLFILPQVSAAGELTPKLLYDKAADLRMLELQNRTARQEIARRIANAVGDILPYLPSTIETSPLLAHQVETVELPANSLTEANVEDARQEAGKLQSTYEAEIKKLAEDPDLKESPRWYVPATAAYRRMNWYRRVEARYEHQKNHPTVPAEIHVVRLGEIVFASNPFEYYLDFGIQIKVKNPALQTFLVQLAGPGTYISSQRAVQSGGYGSVPASNPVGPEGGEILADRTVQLIRSLWPKSH